jgi:hypothetical protein
MIAPVTVSNVVSATMSRKGNRVVAKRKTTAPVPTIPAGSPQLGPHGPTNSVDIVDADAEWSSFTLKDGSVIRVRPSIFDVRHEPGRYNNRGEPVYHFQLSFTVAVVAPPALMQGGAKKKATRKPKG